MFFDDEYNDIVSIVNDIQNKYPDSGMAEGEIYPTNTAPVLAGDNTGTAPFPCKWGFPNFKNKGVIINARSETADTKKTFRESLLKRRCVIPSSGYYEWDKSKNKYLFNIPNEAMLYMAGFYSIFNGEPRFIILTTDANPSVIGIHHRMPVVLERDIVNEWITDTDKALLILRKEPPLLESRLLGTG